MLSRLLLFFLVLPSRINCNDCLHHLNESSALMRFFKATNPCITKLKILVKIQQSLNKTEFVTMLNSAEGKFARNICFQFLLVIVSLELAFRLARCNFDYGVFMASQDVPKVVTSTSVHILTILCLLTGGG